MTSNILLSRPTGMLAHQVRSAAARVDLALGRLSVTPAAASTALADLAELRRMARELDRALRQDRRGGA